MNAKVAVEETDNMFSILYRIRVQQVHVCSPIDQPKLFRFCCSGEHGLCFRYGGEVVVSSGSNVDRTSNVLHVVDGAELSWRNTKTRSELDE